MNLILNNIQGEIEKKIYIKAVNLLASILNMVSEFFFVFPKARKPIDTDPKAAKPSNTETKAAKRQHQIL